MVKVGIIGGTGIEKITALEDVKRLKKHTPYGATSDLILAGRIKGVEIVSIARHGSHHHIAPGLVNYRANIWAMKDLGVTHIIATSASGSLREDIHPGDIIFPDQFIDRTTGRKQSLYEGQEVCHIGMADPFCKELRTLFISASNALKIRHHGAGTVITIEGPRFSTKAESRMYQQWKADIINMSTVPEAVLAREAEICYGLIALSTDYDCWREGEEPVSIELILKRLQEFSKHFNEILLKVIPEVHNETCPCSKALRGALI